MIYREFQDKKLSLLGFGAMRLPLNPDGGIDEAQVAEMTRYAIEHGVNFFDTAFPYHDGHSEQVMGQVLSAYPREQFYLATKFPGHQISSHYDPADIFEKQLKKCGVEYFDFYLLHNVYENSIQTYMDPKWGIVDYFREQKRLGRIKHLGFSTHGSLDIMKRFLDYCGGDMEFCQIQMNYLDWTLQDAKAKYDMLTERGIPVWVMEPVRGGKLAKLEDEWEAKLKALRPDESIPAWAFRFLQGLPNVKMILSGMSNQAQMEDNVRTFTEDKPLSEVERALLLELAEGMKDSVPCTACRYCCSDCPMGLDIPLMLSVYNEMRVAPSMTVTMRLDTAPEEKQPAACIGCGACAKNCPQGIDVPAVIRDLAERMSKVTTWAEICRQREAAAAKLEAQMQD